MVRRQSKGLFPALERLEARALLANNPLVITQGGTYTGTYESTNPAVPAVTVSTTEPVTIENAILRGPGDLIATQIDHAKITVRNTKGYGVNPNVYGRRKGQFIDFDRFDSAVIENNYFESIGGIYLLDYAGNHTSQQSIRVINNRALNIDGRLSNGTGGYLDFNTRIHIVDHHVEHGFIEYQFLQLDKVIALPGVEIAWNQIINEPGNSRVEDNISIFKSSGTADSPILIHDNYVQGAYTIKPTQGNTSDATWQYDWSYSGGGIMLADGLGDTTSRDPAFVQAFNNQVVSTTNYGIAITTGHDIEFFDNRIVSSGLTADGQKIAAQNVGGYVWDSQGVGAARFFRNTARNNTSGWNRGNFRNDFWFPAPGADQGNSHLAGTITPATEAAEFDLWSKKLHAIFPTGTGVPPKLSLTGTIYNDANANGVRDSGEGALTGFRVYLDKDNDGKLDKKELFTRSSSSGRYSFYDLPAATYNVRVTGVNGWRATQGQYARLALKSNKTTKRYFGFTPQALVTGIVFMDANKDGIKGAAEAGLANWRVFADVDGDGLLDKNETSVITDAKGGFVLSLPAGAYQLRVAAKTGYRRTFPAVNFYALSLVAGTTAGPFNFGQKRTL